MAEHRADDQELKEEIDPFGQIGVTGLHQHSGIIHEEFLNELHGVRGTRIYREMHDNDPVIGAILFVIDMLIRSVTWHAVPASQSAADVEAAEFLDEVRDDMEMTWSSVISEILTMLPFGWALLEEVYKVRGGESDDPMRNSRFNDGKIGWRKLPIRAQETLWRWIIKDNGDVTAMVQQPPPDFVPRTIPMDKSLLFRTTNRKGNPEGRSILRNAYRPWFFKKRIEEIEGVGIERDLAGLPVAGVPATMLQQNASSEDKQTVAFVKKLVTNIRRDSQEGVVWPIAYDEQNNKLFTLELLSTGGRRQFDTTKIITRYDQRIAMVVVADFILLGHEKVGSFALASSKTNIFSIAIKAFLDEIASVFNRVAIPRLFALNSFSLESLPRLEFSNIETPELTDIVNALSQMSLAGAEIFPSEDLLIENQILRWAGLPEIKHTEG